ncbi:hypothetical protein L195_g057587 [Trifolium pratense]|uniref:Uncharacterized protein n=1 Tax=Trifolium pratense TaxID=57577 RepID=A0A2K3KWG1_TRIPR|nr:hypothetical protein L195_g057587 [Trifolium pratense]
MAPPSPPSNAQSLLAPPPTPSNKTTFYALLGFSFLHLLVLGAYLIVHATGHTQMSAKQCPNCIFFLLFKWKTQTVD